MEGENRIIICDGVPLTVQDGISVSAGKTLNIYGQATESGILKCIADTNNNTAVWSDYNIDCGMINIHGANVIADTKNDGEDAAVGSPALIGDSFLLGLTGIRLTCFTKSLLPGNCPRMANPLAERMRSLVKTTSNLVSAMANFPVIFLGIIYPECPKLLGFQRQIGTFPMC